MKIVIFGATGTTGLCAVSAALSKGYEVTAFVRNPDLLPSDIKPHSVVKGDVLNESSVDEAIKNQDAVVVVLGTRNVLEPTTVMSVGTKNILKAMTNNGVKIIICCLSSFMFWERTKIPSIFINICQEHERMLDALKTSQHEWVAVCPPHISDTPAREGYVLENDKPVGKEISKHDLGKILIECIHDDSRIGHLVAMGYSP